MSRNVSDTGGAPRHAADFVLERFEAEGVLDRDRQPLGADRLDDEIRGPGPHGRDDRVDGAVRRLHDGRHGDLALPHAGQDRHAVDLGHHQVADQQVHAGQVRRFEPGQGRRAAVEDLGVVAEATHHGFEQAALHGIVVDDENGSGHASPKRRISGPLARYPGHPG